jgi:hypothetical protein
VKKYSIKIVFQLNSQRLDLGGTALNANKSNACLKCLLAFGPSLRVKVRVRRLTCLTCKYWTNAELFLGAQHSNLV